MKIKICGLTRKEEIGYVNEIGPDYIGFIFYKGSRRYVNINKARELKRGLSKSILSAGVFVNEDIDLIKKICEGNIIEVIQLHGDESPAFIDELKKVTGRPIIKAIRVQNQNQLSDVNGLSADYLLFDTYHNGMYGGTGEKFDWNLIENIKKPFFLAGGITIKDISKAEKLGAYCLDVSSSVETNGIKDKEKIEEIVIGVRNRLHPPSI